jgi:ATP-dependent Clp protease adaptor protein ClpS
MPQPDTTTTTSAKTEKRLMPLYRVLLHNDDVNSMEHVVNALQTVFGMNLTEAIGVMLEAHSTGVALCKIEPLEPAELHRDQLQTYSLTATLEPA